MVVLVAMGPHRDMVAFALVPWGAAFGALLHLVYRHPEWVGRGPILLGGAILLRFLWLPTFPDLSDDMFRYVWDGLLSTRGIRPFEHVPSADVLAEFHGSVLYRDMNSPNVHSIYPALSQAVFAAGGLLYEAYGWTAAQLGVNAGFLALETGGLAFLYRALRRNAEGKKRSAVTDRHVALLALWAWNPLALLVVAGGGHTEGGLVAGIGLLLAATTFRSPLWQCAGLWAGWTLASLAKGIPLVLWPLVWRATATRSGPVAATIGGLAAIAACALLSWPFVRPEDLAGVMASANLYVHHFEFNAALYPLLKWAIEALPFALPGADPTAGGGHAAGSILRAVFLLGALVLVVRHPTATLRDLATGLLLVFSLYLVTATTVHPWYLLWVLPLVPFTARLRGPWLWGSAAAFATYLTYSGTPHTPLQALFWGGWLVLLLNEEREWVLRPLRAVAARRKAGWIRPWLAGSRILDVGGGEGALAHALASGVPERHLTVLDPGALSGRRSTHPGTTGRIRGRGEELPFPSASAHTVVLAFVLHHSRDPDAVLGEALRVSSNRVVILESTCPGPIRCRLLAGLDRWINAARAGSEVDGPGAIQYRTAPEWVRAAREVAQAMDGSATRQLHVLTRDRPSRWGHSVARIVLEWQPVRSAE